MPLQDLNGGQKLRQAWPIIEQNEQYLDNKIDTHVADKNNPHGVTAAQVGAETPTGAQAKADAVQTNLNTHANNATVHLSTDDRTKLASIQSGAEPNQNAFSQVNNVAATVETDALTIAGGTGITVTTNPATKTVTVTATGDATPGPHATTHITGGTDVIPDAVTGGNSGLMSGADAQFVRVDGETKTGAQEKANVVQSNLNAHLAEKATSSTLGHVKVDGTTISIDANGVISAVGGGDVQATNADITYFVNASTGNDTNDGLSSGTAFKTIQHAISLLPQVINHTININVAAGTYAENVILSGYVGRGSITITGNSAVGTTHTTTSLRIENCYLKATVSGFNVTITSGAAVTILNCINVLLRFMNIVAAATSASGIQIDSSLVWIRDSTISNRNQAIYAGTMSTVLSFSNSGTSNTIGLYANSGSTIAKSTTQPTGATAETTANGGAIR